ncbi:hypothetical protein F5Y16DRAFT_395175 [Xylariaceae sp. FL0255]|nr:hypothetical protein F5Y16DRAFT_395175 [Xylariaceae sp. FL0255]
MPRRWTLAYAIGGTKRFSCWESWEVEESFSLLLAECGTALKIGLFIDGLDEFDVSPAAIADLVQRLASKAGNSLKFCIASRPWTEFNDAFHRFSMVQIHLLTNDDITKFVNGKLNDNRGFEEIARIYPAEMSALAEKVIRESEGVLL